MFRQNGPRSLKRHYWIKLSLFNVLIIITSTLMWMCCMQRMYVDVSWYSKMKKMILAILHKCRTWQSCMIAKALLLQIAKKTLLKSHSVYEIPWCLILVMFWEQKVWFCGHLTAEVTCYWPPVSAKAQPSLIAVFVQVICD